METGGSGRVRAEINVTPLVDIVLVLLIIFIVITPAVHDAVRLPKARNSARPAPGERPLSLALAAARDAAGHPTGPGSIVVEAPGAKAPSGPSYSIADEAGRQRLRSFIAASVKATGDRRVLVKADADLPFKYVDRLFQLCREAGALEASIVTREDRKGGA